MSGAEGGSRTRTTLRSTDFKSVASAIPPPRHRARKNSTPPNSRQTIQESPMSKVQSPKSKVQSSKFKVQSRPGEKKLSTSDLERFPMSPVIRAPPQYP